MPINPDLLIAAPMLQDYLVDKSTGLPLAAGIITLHSETQRSLLKNWYTQQGTNPPYIYVPLPNPMTLSAVGTIQDLSGNDVIPYYYPVSEVDNSTPETYFIIVTNSNLQLQFTRSNFPFVGTGTGGNTVDSNDSLIVNSSFWRNIGTFIPFTAPSTIRLNNTITYSLNGVSSTFFYAIVAPSQHDGYIMTDIAYFKDVNNDGDETLTFKKFSSNFDTNILKNDVTPEFYLNVKVSTPGTATKRFLQIPISLHIDSLSAYPSITITLQAMAVTGAPTLQIGLFQFAGTGGNSVSASIKSFVLGPTWQKLIAHIPIPNPQGVVTGVGGDDALYLQIIFPNISSEINIALPEMYLSDIASTNTFETYDQVNSIISSPRTGDVRISNNGFSSFGWTTMNDGIISLNPFSANPSHTGVSRNNADTWPLFNLLWNLAKPYDGHPTPNTNPICQMFTNLGVTTSFGTSAYNDFNANNRALLLTRMLGKAFMGTVPMDSLLANPPYNNVTRATTFSTFNGTGTLGINTAPIVMDGFNGCPIIFQGSSLPGGVNANQIYFMTGFDIPSQTTFAISDSYALAIARTPKAWVSDGTGTVIIAPTGINVGEFEHKSLLYEMPQHTHNPLIENGFLMTPGSFTNAGNSNPSRQAATTGGVTGYPASGQVPFNVTHPSVYYNIFIKL